MRNALAILLLVVTGLFAATTSEWNIVQVNTNTGVIYPQVDYNFASTQTMAFLTVTNLTLSGTTNFPAAGFGLIYWNAGSNALYGCDGTNWHALW